LQLNLTNAAGNLANYWGTGGVTSSVFGTYPSTGAGNNFGTDNMIAYCFHSVDGYSKFGSYTGNGSSDGPFVYTGFRPKFVLWKKSSAAEDWRIYDGARDTYNVNSHYLVPNTSGAEINDTGTGSSICDFTSNGFKIRGTSGSSNSSGATYIFACFAEYPFKYTTAR